MGGFSTTLTVDGEEKSIFIAGEKIKSKVICY
jgi:hypothetical protein